MIKLVPLFRRFLPKISNSEKIALQSGTVGLDRLLFENNLRSVLPEYKVWLSESEQNFLNQEVNDLCRVSHPFDTSQRGRLADMQMDKIRQKTFLGLCVPESWGGKGFSSYAHARVIQKLSSRCPSMATTVMVPNSLGPAELLLKYGTPEQQKRWLPGLTSGEILPCFALTGPLNGSDALGKLDRGRMIDDHTIEFTCDKRWITLAPVADLVGLAIDVEGHGPTLLLLDRDEQSLDIGTRHFPMGSFFMNGPIRTRHPVRVKTDRVIGGPSQLGRGWEMLMECLNEGRGISLPSLSSGVNCFLTIQTCYYAKARKQFGRSLTDMEGVQEKLAAMVADTYCSLVLQELINASLLKGERSGVLSAMLKCRSTELARANINRAMDIFAGKGITTGWKNPVAHFYSQIPVAITVEGSNTLTRSLLVFAQGINKSHPYVGPMVAALENEDEKAFRELFLKMFFYLSRHVGRGVLSSPWSSLDSRVEHRNALFILLSCWMLFKGKNLKQNQTQTGRMADLLSDLLTCYALRWFDRCEWLEDLLIQKTLNDIDRTILKICAEENNILLTSLCAPFFPTQQLSDRQWLSISKALFVDPKIDDLLASRVYLDSQDPLVVYRELFRNQKNIPDELIRDIVAVDAFVDNNVKKKKEPVFYS